ncbi:hypothetical protein ASZ90_005524 [hydrocarbon metagenome]|uniref:PhoU domain-containing protein n=1 Tax=hydrocarbon metagenome TaxID=938273 RepID=A0A0W8FUU4_9ZZZZ
MALANQKQVEDIADKLSECADSIHVRLMKAIKNKEIDQYTAQLIFQDEATMRQRANSLYIDAANCVVEGLFESQKSIISLIDAAKDKIKTIKKIAGFMDFIADLLVLVAAAYAAKPAPILAALEEIRKDVETLNKS